MSTQYTISAIAACLGYLDGDDYKKEPDCIDLIRDLIRFIRLDSAASCVNRRSILSTKILSNDLLNILRCYPDDNELFDLTLRLTLNLSQEPYASFQKRPHLMDSQTLALYMQVLEAQQEAKSHFGDERLMKTFNGKLVKFLETEELDRSHETEETAKRILAFVRNILAIQPLSSTADHQANLATHNRIVEAMLNSGLSNTLILIAGRSKEASLHLFICELLAHVFYHYKADELAAALNDDMRQTIKTQSDEKLAAALAECRAKQTAKLSQITRRHTNFAGHYTIENMKAVGKQHNMITGRVIENSDNLKAIRNMDERKTKKRAPKNRRELVDDQTTISCTPFEIKQKLAIFVRQFLTNVCDTKQKEERYCYNQFVKSLRSILQRTRSAITQAGTTTHDQECYYACILSFCMMFTRIANIEVKYILETVSTSQFHWAQCQIGNFMEMASTDKSSCRVWGLRQTFIMQAYNELLLVIQWMGASQHGKIRRLAADIKQEIFYQVEYRDLLPSLFRKYNPVFNSRRYLTYLVSATHVYLRLLQKQCESGNMIVQRKVKVKKNRWKSKKKSVKSEDKSDENPSTSFVQPSLEQLDNAWKNKSETLCQLLQGHDELDKALLDSVIPVDALVMEKCADEKEQQMMAMVRIQDLLHFDVSDSVENENSAKRALALYHAARTIWPGEPFIFGSNDMDPEEEYIELQNIHYEDFNAEREKLHQMNIEIDGVISPNSPVINSQEEKLDDEEELFEGNYSGSEDEIEGMYAIAEKEIKFDDYLNSFISIHVVKCYVHLLDDFMCNSMTTNSHIVRYLYRIATNEDIGAMLYSGELFAIFQKLNSKFHYNARYKEISDLARFICSKFIKDLQKQPLTAVELLFDKTKAEAYDIRNGYDASSKRKEMAKQLWTEETEQEVRSLFTEFDSLEDRPPDIDVAEYIETNLTVERNRKQIVRFLKHLNLVDKTALRAARKEELWPKSLINELSGCYDQYLALEDRDPAQDLADYCVIKLSSTRSRKQIIRRLKKLGLEVESLIRRKSSKKSKSEKRKKILKETVAMHNFLAANNDDSDEKSVASSTPSVRNAENKNRTSKRESESSSDLMSSDDEPILKIDDGIGNLSDVSGTAPSNMGKNIETNSHLSEFENQNNPLTSKENNQVISPAPKRRKLMHDDEDYESQDKENYDKSTAIEEPIQVSKPRRMIIDDDDD